MQNYQTNIEDLSKCTVAIQEAGSIGKVLGTGVIVTDDGLILTCFHVVGDIKNKIINHNSIYVYFPEYKITKSAQVVKEYCDPSIDIAFFKIENGSLSNKTTVSNLGEGIIFGHKFASIGFRKPKVFEKLSSSGEIRIKTSFKTKEDTESPQLIQLYSDEIEPGMSGAPVLDLETNKVVGIISEHWMSASNNVDTRLNFGIPIETILKVPATESILRERNPGLKKIHQFMEKICLGKSKIYQRFDDVYVAPTEYNEIEETLRENNCVFITGTAEYGKTFTAIKLLWEYSKKDIHITPKYIPEEGKDESKDIIKKLKNQDEDLQNTVIYLEDPIGKYKYESNPEFESSFVDIIESLHDLNIYLIITSREEIYQQFHPIGGLDTITKKFVKKLNIGKRSYDYEKRKEMLVRWAAIYRCRWLEDDKLKNVIFETIKNNDAKLSTPLNIKDFAYATRYESSNAIVLDNKKEDEELIKILDKKSERTPEVFAEEIKGMEPEKILFLCFLFVSGRFPIEFVKGKYKELVNDLSNEFKIGEGEDALKFERVLDSFRDSKVDISYDAFNNKYTLRFSHPSYYEAILVMISKNGAFKLSRKILSIVLLKLFSTSSEVALIVASYFDKLPENVQNLLSKIPDNKISAQGIAFAVAANFDRLPENVQNLLFKLADNQETAGMAALVIGVNFDRLPENVQNLLFKLADNQETARDVAYTIADNYDKLPENVQNLLFKLAENKEIAASVSFAISFCFDRLPENVQNLLFKLADNQETARDVANIVIWNYKLPDHVRKILLFKLADNDKEIAASVADVVSYNFDRLSDNIRNELFKLADNKEASGNISYAVANNFDKLSDNVRNELLLKPADHKETATYIAWFTAYNFDKLPYNVRNYLFMFADDKETAASVADAVAWQFDKLPDNVRNLLFKLADDKETAASVADAVAKNFYKLPDNVRNELLIKVKREY